MELGGQVGTSGRDAVRASAQACGRAGVVAAGRRREPFLRPVVLAGWSSRSAWGYDDVLECYWAELWPAVRCESAWRESGWCAPGRCAPGRCGPAVRVGPEHLITTVAGLARAIGRATGAGDAEAYLALTA